MRFVWVSEWVNVCPWLFTCFLLIKLKLLLDVCAFLCWGFIRIVIILELVGYCTDIAICHTHVVVAYLYLFKLFLDVDIRACVCVNAHCNWVYTVSISFTIDIFGYDVNSYCGTLWYPRNPCLNLNIRLKVISPPIYLIFLHRRCSCAWNLFRFESKSLIRND